MNRLLNGLIICLLISVQSFSQSVKGGFFVTGRVKVDQGVLDGTVIEIDRNNIRFQEVAINRTGSFRVQVDLNHIYKFSFKNPDYYTKSIELDTRIPPNACSGDCDYPPYQLSVILYKKVPGVNLTEEPSGKISYNQKIDNFDAEILRDGSDLRSMINNALTEAKQKSATYEQQRTRDKKNSYDKLIKDADLLNRNGNFEQAMKNYRDAVLIFPEEKYPRDKVDQLYQLLISFQLSKSFGNPDENNYLKYLTYGDQKFADREYTVSKVAFEMAATYKINESSIKDRLLKSDAEIKKMRDLAMEEVSHKKQVYHSRTLKYRELVSKADEMLKKEDIAAAKDFYAQAVTQIDENSYALLMMQKIGEIISNDELALKLAKDRDEAEKKKLADARNQAYADAIYEADQLFQKRLYRDAIEYYELALTIKSYEFYPRKQIKDINDILAKLQLNGEEYNRLLSEGEVYFKNENYTSSRESYLKAHNLIPDERFALKKIVEIDELIARLKKEKEVQEQYDKTIADADLLFKSNKYGESISKYQVALSIKPGEKYPKEQIDKIRAIITKSSTDQIRNVQAQTEYDQAISQADAAFNRYDYQQARSLYQRALTIIPGQEYPTFQIRRIDEILKEPPKQPVAPKSILDMIDFSNLEKLTKEERERAYKEAMALGEQFMKTSEWGIARFYFRRAISLVPGDVPATQKLNESEAKIRGGDVNESKFNELIKKADESFRSGDISVAKFYYSKALEIKPADQYAKERLDVTDQLLRSTSARASDRDFDEMMNKGNEAFNSKNYSLARFYYRKAVSLKPDSQLAKERSELTERALRQDKTDVGIAEYEKNISFADKAFKEQRYGVAMSYYKQALTTKPQDPYALGQIVKIEKLLKKP